VGVGDALDGATSGYLVALPDHYPVAILLHDA
jgi:hypothetical protein